MYYIDSVTQSMQKVVRWMTRYAVWNTYITQLNIHRIMLCKYTTNIMCLVPQTVSNTCQAYSSLLTGWHIQSTGDTHTACIPVPCESTLQCKSTDKYTIDAQIHVGREVVRRLNCLTGSDQATIQQRAQGVYSSGRPLLQYEVHHKLLT